MGCVKKLGMIFLAVYLIITGVVKITGVAPSYTGDVALQMIAIISGVLILISIGSFMCKHDSCDHH